MHFLRFLCLFNTDFVLLKKQKETKHLLLKEEIAVKHCLAHLNTSSFRKILLRLNNVKI